MKYLFIAALSAALCSCGITDSEIREARIGAPEYSGKLPRGLKFGMPLDDFRKAMDTVGTPLDWSADNGFAAYLWSSTSTSDEKKRTSVMESAFSSPNKGIHSYTILLNPNYKVDSTLLWGMKSGINLTYGSDGVLLGEVLDDNEIAIVFSDATIRVECDDESITVSFKDK